MNNLFEYENTGAIFSDCRKYRYALWRIWDETKPFIMFVGLNPSTANENTDDPTIIHVKKFAKGWGYGGVYMTNLFAIISSKPEILLSGIDLQKDNDKHLVEIRTKCKDVLFAWGMFKQAKQRRNEVKEMFPDALCIAKRNDLPVHPLWAGVYAKDKSNFNAPIKFNQNHPSKNNK